MKNLLFLIPVILLSCTQSTKTPDTNQGKAVAGLDPHSFANPKENVVTHLDLSTSMIDRAIEIILHLHN